MNETYIKYLTSLCEGRNLLREYEQYYDPDTGLSRDDGGNVWRGPTNPRYDVSDRYWQHHGTGSYKYSGGRYGHRSYPRSGSATKSPKVIEKEKLYFGRAAKTEAQLVYFMYQAYGLICKFFQLPAGTEKRDEDEIRRNLVEMLKVFLEDEDIADFKIDSTTQKDVRDRFLEYFRQPAGNRDAEPLKKELRKHIQK